MSESSSTIWRGPRRKTSARPPTNVTDIHKPDIQGESQSGDGEGLDQAPVTNGAGSDTLADGLWAASANGNGHVTTAPS